MPIHELCKITTSPTSVRFSKDEISDDEEEGEDDDDSNEDDAAEELDQIFDACELEEGTKMYEVTQFMIDISHSLGPIRVLSARDQSDDENDNNNRTDLSQIDEQQRGIGRNEPIGLGNDGDDESTGNVTGEDGDVESSRGDGNSSGKVTVHESILTWTDSMGKTPLHVLCENSCDVNMLRVILGSTREATGNPRSPPALSLILAKDSRGSTPLHYLVYSRQCPFSSLKLMMEYCKPHASHHHDKYEYGKRNCIDPTLCTDVDGETPLHWALAGYVSSRRIKELTRYSVDAIMVRNQKGETPFDQFTTNFVDSDWTEHDICGNEVWENIQGYLRVIHDNEIGIKHRISKNIAISNRKQRMSGIDDNYIESGRQVKYEGSIDWIDSEWLPLHFLAGSAYDFPSIFMDFALRYCSDDLRKPDANGMLPLHLACGREKKEISNLIVSKSNNETTNTKRSNSTNAIGSLAMKILKKFQRASMTEVPSTKRLPLHLAVDTKKPLSLIAALIRTYPRSLNIADPVTKLWPYVLAGARNDGKQSVDNESLSVSFALLRADPSVLHLVLKNEYVSNLTESERSRSASYNSNVDNDSTTEEESYKKHSNRRIRRLTMDRND